MSSYKVIVSDNRHGDYSIETEILKQVDADLEIANCTTVEDMLISCRNVDGILLDMAPLSKEVVAGLQRCRVVSRYGVGYDNVDLEACTKKGIQVTNVPDYCAEDVSDHALALFLSLARHITIKDNLVRQGKWNIAKEGIKRIKGKTFALFGFGTIAKCLCKKISCLGLKEILVYDPYVSSENISGYNARKVELNEALEKADYISLHMPVTPETRNLINSETIAKMKSNVIIINTSRGPLVNDSALLEALKNKLIGGAGLDTHNQEPLPKDSPYLKLDNCIVTDHTAYFSEEAIRELKTKAAENIRDTLLGIKPKYPVNSLI